MVVIMVDLVTTLALGAPYPSNHVTCILHVRPIVHPRSYPLPSPPLSTFQPKQILPQTAYMYSRGHAPPLPYPLNFRLKTTRKPAPRCECTTAKQRFQSSRSQER